MDESTKRPLKVFLCHSAGDKSAVRGLCERLTAEKVDVWLDQEKLMPGQDWQLEIPKAVRESDVVVICLSKKSVTKEGYVQKEIKFALDIAEEKPEGIIFLIPARLEECIVPERLNRWQWVDLFEEKGFAKLMDSLKLRAEIVGAKVRSRSHVGKPKDDGKNGGKNSKPSPKPPLKPRPGIYISIRIIFSILIIAGVFIGGTVVVASNPALQALLRSPTPAIEASATATQIASECKLPGASNVFVVDQYYKPKQYMGDTGDIRKVAGGTPNPIQFEYMTNGEGPHEWEYKYINMVSNLNPAQFAGIMFIDSAGPGGTDPNNGYDLRGYKLIKWEARSIQGDVNVEFVIGGVTWNWDEQNKKMIPAPYPDSIKSPISIGKPTLTSQWKEFEFVIQTKLEEDSLQCVVGVFGWVITWGDAGVKMKSDASGPENPKTLEIEIRNIRYEK